jgi:hypothetical protein
MVEIKLAEPAFWKKKKIDTSRTATDMEKKVHNNAHHARYKVS